MSRARDNPNQANPNSPWLLYSTVRRTNRESSIAIAANALNEIRENVRRALDYSSESETSPPVHIIMEREFSFNEIDRSILANIENNRPATEHISHFGQINRRNSLTQLDGSIFVPTKHTKHNLEKWHNPLSNRQSSHHAKK